MGASKMVKNVLGDINKTIDELYAKNLIRDYRAVSNTKTAKNTFEISFPDKNRSLCNIVYDKHVSCEEIMDKLLKGYQYNALLYDKSIIPVSYTHL